MPISYSSQSSFKESLQIDVTLTEGALFNFMQF